MKNKKFLYALTTLVGMIIGVGIFGIPYAVAQAGFLIGVFYFGLLAGAVLLIHLLYGEIVLRTPGQHRLVGYGEKYLGAFGKKATGAIIIFEFYGAMLVYIIAGGHFLNLIFGGGDNLWAMIFFAFGALLILLGLRFISLSELFMTIFLIMIPIAFIIKGAPLWHFVNLSKINWAKFFLPYGVILFSLTGGAAIPEMRQILGNDEPKLKKAIVLGTLIPAVLYLLLVLAILGLTGDSTTENALDGLTAIFGRSTVIVGSVFGFLAVFSSFLVLGLNLRRVFWLDYKLNRFLAWVLACFAPLAIYLLGVNNFIFVIGLVGALAGGLEGIIIILIWQKAKKAGERRPEYSLKIGRIILYGLILLFVLGIIYQLVYLF